MFGPGTGSRLDMAPHYITFGFRAPITQYRVLTCEEAGCENWRRGFRVLCDMSTPLGRERAAYLRSGVHGRRYTEHYPEGAPTRIEFSFPPRTSCFAKHRVPVERHVAHIIRRGMPGRSSAPETVTPTEWHERLGDNQTRLRDLQQKGW